MIGLALILVWLVASGVAANLVLSRAFSPATFDHSRLCLNAQDSPEHDQALARARRLFLPLVTLQASMCVAQFTLVGYGRHIGGALWAFYVFGLLGVILTGFYIWLWREYAARLDCFDLDALEREITAKVRDLIEHMTKARTQWRSN